MMVRGFIKKLFGKFEGSTSVQNESVTFPGGIMPIAETKPNDVFVVGYPKSGNTLMQHIIAHLYYGLNGEASRSLINLIAPDVYANPNYFRFNDVCFFKSHDRPDPRFKKVIYIMRDGREALLSYYHMMRNMGQEISLEQLYSGKINIYGGSWSDHIKAWDQNPFNANILWIKYEDLIENKVYQLKRICEFLEINRTDNEIDEVVENTSFGHMQELERRSDWQRMNKAYFVKGNFVRKGSLSSYTKEVDGELINIFESKNKEMLRKHYQLDD